MIYVHDQVNYRYSDDLLSEATQMYSMQYISKELCVNIERRKGKRQWQGWNC